MAETAISGPVGDVEIAFRAGELAQLADGAVTVAVGDTEVLVTAAASSRPRENADFFPLTIAFSVARPSLRKKEPGMRPTA